jgi:hypothetical protein
VFLRKRKFAIFQNFLAPFFENLKFAIFLKNFGAIFFKEAAWGGERTRVLSISFIFSFSPLYR